MVHCQQHLRRRQLPLQQQRPARSHPITCSVRALVYLVTMKFVRLTAYAMQLLTSSVQKNAGLACNTVMTCNHTQHTAHCAWRTQALCTLYEHTACCWLGCARSQIQLSDAGRPGRCRLTSPNTPGSRMSVEGSSSMTLKLLM